RHLPESGLCKASTLEVALISQFHFFNIAMIGAQCQPGCSTARQSRSAAFRLQERASWLNSPLFLLGPQPEALLHPEGRSPVPTKLFRTFLAFYPLVQYLPCRLGHLL